MNGFFREVAKFLLEVGCVHVNAYGMPKKKAGVIIETFERKAVDWGVITGLTLREGLHSYQSEKKLRPIIQQYPTVLFPPHSLRCPTPSQPSLGSRFAKRRLVELVAVEWEEEPQPSQAVAQPTPKDRPTHSEPTVDQEDEPRQGSLRPKRRRLERKDGRGLVKDAPTGVEETTGTDITDGGADPVATERATPRKSGKTDEKERKTRQTKTRI